MGSRATMETTIRILIFGAMLQVETARLRLEFLSRGVELPSFTKEDTLEAYLRHHPVDAFIVDRSGSRVSQRLREYENVQVGYELTDPALLEATILKIIASRPRRPARRAA